MKKRLCVFAVLCLFTAVFCVRSKAEENTILDQVLTLLYERPATVEVLAEEPSDTILALKLRKTPMAYTFASEMPLSGTAQPGDQIEIAVFTVDESGHPILWHHNSILIGASGLLQEKVPLTLTGLQRLLIGVTHEDKTAVRVYAISRKSEAVLEQLLNYDLNLYEEFGRR